MARELMDQGVGAGMANGGGRSSSVSANACWTPDILAAGRLCGSHDCGRYHV
jgi:hypothetical protein